MSKKQTVFIVTAQQSEGGWGFPDFQAEVYDSETRAQKRAYQLNNARAPYCGYYYASEPATLKFNTTKTPKTK